MEHKQQEMVRFEKAQGGQFRWVAVTALLLAIGAILHLVTPNVGGVTPNWTIAMYCIAINLTRPSLGRGRRHRPGRRCSQHSYFQVRVSLRQLSE